MMPPKDPSDLIGPIGTLVLMVSVDAVLIYIVLTTSGPKREAMIRAVSIAGGVIFAAAILAFWGFTIWTAQK